MDYKKISLKTSLHVEEIVSVHYLEYTKDFSFAGESHNFWEFIYVDRGEVSVTAGKEEFILKPKQLFLHKPMEFHSLRCVGTSASDAIVISFTCGCKELIGLSGRILNCPSEAKPLLATIVAESKDAFSTNIGDPHVKELVRKQDQTFACEQLIQINLEEFLIRIIRSDWQFFKHVFPHEQQHFPNIRFEAICDYLEKNVEKRLMFEDICEACSIGASALKKLFHDNAGCGVMEYLGRLKCEKAKQLIREQDMSYTQIADYLHYTTVQYFSRHFKRVVNMTPSEYANSVKRFMR